MSAPEMAEAQPFMQTAASDRSLPWLNSKFEIALLFLLPFILYVESFGFPIMGLDDTAYYFDSSLQGGRLDGLRTLWSVTILSDYSPVTQLTIWLDLALFGDQSWWGARLHNLAWFGLGTLAWRALLLRLGVRRGVVFSVCLLYALHPICTQAVLWLAERKHLVSLALCLWALERYVAARQAKERVHFLRDYGAAFLLGVAAIFSKPHAVALPPMILAYELAMSDEPWKKRLLLPLPFFIAAGAFTLWSLTQVRDDLGRAFLGGSRLAALICDGPILWRYLGHLFLPVNLAVYYYVPEHGADWLAGWAIWAGLLALVGATVWLARERRLVLFGWMVGLAALSPALNLVAQVAPMCDHYQQWALPGLLLAFAVLVSDRLDLYVPNGARPKLGMAVTGIAALACAGLAWVRIPEFSSMKNLFAAAVLKQSDSALNWSLYTWALNQSKEKNDREALGAAALRALESPDMRRILPEVRMTCTVRAAIRLHQNGADDRARKLIEEQAALLEQDAPPIVAQMARGWSYLRLGDNAAAIAALQDVYTPELAEAAKRLRADCRSGAKLPNELPPVTVLAIVKQSTELNVMWTSVMKLSSLSVLAEAKLADGKVEEAFDIAAAVVNLDPKFEEGRQVLARAYRALGVPAAAERLLAMKLTQSN